jgi:hypothetical protein
MAFSVNAHSQTCLLLARPSAVHQRIAVCHNIIEPVSYRHKINAL